MKRFKLKCYATVYYMCTRLHQTRRVKNPCQEITKAQYVYSNVETRKPINIKTTNVNFINVPRTILSITKVDKLTSGRVGNRT